MRFSFWSGTGHDWPTILRSLVHAEAVGYDGVWVADHFMPNEGDIEGDTHEAWTLLAAIAAQVPRVRIGPMVAGNTYRHPAVLAKQAATVDHISGGRVVLGIGSGWQENEHTAYGLEFGTFTERFAKLDEACTIIRSLLDNTRTDFAGTHYTITDAPLSPKPVQDKMPLLIGGGGEKVTLKLVARHADEWNVWSTPEILAQKSGVLDQHCADQDRDPATIQRCSVTLLFMNDDDAANQKIRDLNLERPHIVGTVGELQERLGNYRDAGCDELIIPDFTFGSEAQKLETVERFITEVAADFR
ncbi:MAG: LLM class F420-dependent oxidoreductase [Actinomycetia bacterium]|nr:LLM class F420-dependent oxidoreductase [Actinomycetes bacterium]